MGKSAAAEESFEAVLDNQKSPIRPSYYNAGKGNVLDYFNEIEFEKKNVKQQKKNKSRFELLREYKRNKQKTTNPNHKKKQPNHNTSILPNKKFQFPLQINDYYQLSPSPPQKEEEEQIESKSNSNGALDEVVIRHRQRWNHNNINIEKNTQLKPSFSASLNNPKRVSVGSIDGLDAQVMKNLYAKQLGELIQMEKENEQLTNEYEEMKVENNKLKKKNNVSQQLEVTKLQEQLHQSEEKLSKVKAKLLDSTSVVNSTKLQHEACKELLQQNSFSTDEGSGKNSFFNPVMNEEKTFQLKAELLQSEKLVEQKSEALLMLREEQQQDKATISQLKQQCENNVQKVQHLESQYSALELKLQDNEKQNQNALVEFQTIVDINKEYELKFQLKEREYVELEEKLVAANAKITEYEKELSKKNDEVSSIENQASQLSAQVLELKALLNSANENKSDYVADIKNYEAQLKHKNDTLEESLQKVKEYEVKYSNLSIEKSSKIQELKKIVEDLNLKNSTLEHQIARRNLELERLQNDMETIAYPYQRRIESLEKDIKRGEIFRRKLHDKVMQLKGNIRVFCRVRPLLQEELKLQKSKEEVFYFPDRGYEKRLIDISAPRKSHVSYRYSNGSSPDKVEKKFSFEFDQVFDDTHSQEEFFVEVAGLVQSAIDGHHVCIFAYGQTGSGKTYTMQGKANPISDNFHIDEADKDVGIIGRSLSYIFKAIQEEEEKFGCKFSVNLEMVEIYNEIIVDLLDSSNIPKVCELKLDCNGSNQPVVTNLVTKRVATCAEALRHLKRASLKRATKRTRMNDRSSRSHAVTTLRLACHHPISGDTRQGLVHLVDLAGSERLSQSGSGSNAIMLKEAQSINSSLTSLGNVISSISRKERHVPFRDSKLTYLLQPSLGGNSKTLMICNLSPLADHQNESLNSLRFAKKVNSCEIAYSSVVKNRS